MKLYVKVFPRNDFLPAKRQGNDYIVDYPRGKRFVRECYVTEERIEKRSIIKKQKQQCLE